MKTRKLGATDLEFSTVGIGTWPMGGAGPGMSWGPQDDNVSIATIETAVNNGINWLDTSGAYGRGHSEEVVGMALKKLSMRPYITTKCGTTFDEDGKTAFRLDRADVRAQCEASLKRMGIDYIDVYLIHWPNPAEYMEEGWQTCADLVKEGKVRYTGVSNFTIGQMDVLQKIHPIACMEPPYSMIERRIEEEILDYCKKHNMGVVVYSPLQQGILTGTMKGAGDIPSDFRSHNPHFKEPEFSENMKLVANLIPIAEKYGCSVARLAIAWVLRRPEVTSAINGARTTAEIEDSIRGGNLEVAQEDWAAVDRLLAKREKIIPPAPPLGTPPGAGPRPPVKD